MAWINVDIDLDDVYDEMGRHEKELMVEWLWKDGYLPELDRVENLGQYNTGSPLDEEWTQMIQKIHDARYQLTPDQEAVLIKLYNTL